MVTALDKTRIIINIDGNQGNAFYILGTCLGLINQLQWSEEDKEDFKKTFYSQGYDDNLLMIEHFFGDFIEIQTKNSHYLKLFEI